MNIPKYTLMYDDDSENINKINQITCNKAMVKIDKVSAYYFPFVVKILKSGTPLDNLKICSNHQYKHNQHQMVTSWSNALYVFHSFTYLFQLYYLFCCLFWWFFFPFNLIYLNDLFRLFMILSIHIKNTYVLMYYTRPEDAKKLINVVWNE